MHGVGVIHLKDEFPKNYVQTWYTKQTQLAIYSNFIRLIRGPKPTKVRRKESNEPQAIERLTKRGVETRCSKCNKKGHNKRSCKEKVKRHKFGVHNQVVAPNQQETTQLKRRLPQLTNKMLLQEEIFHSRGNQPQLDGCLLLKSHP
ncbi:hypothetical protein Gotur_010293 [Gossypium turneri]